jgi:SMODS and SLOG-associating 2TM effector domain 2
MKPTPATHAGAYRSFPEAPEAYRDAGREATLKALFDAALIHAEDRIAWYDRKAGSCAQVARCLRVAALVLFALGTLAPIVGTLLVRLAIPAAQLPFAECGYVLLAIAGALVIFDQFFGVSSSWIRFRQSQARLEVMLAELRFSWAGLMAKYGTNAAMVDTAECIGLLHDFVIRVERLSEEETREWAMNYQSQINAFDRSTELRRSTAGPPLEASQRVHESAIHLTITNAHEIEGLVLTVNDKPCPVPPDGKVELRLPIGRPQELLAKGRRAGKPVVGKLELTPRAGEESRTLELRAA